MSKLGLLLKNEFPAFQEAPGLYPAHLTVLLDVDLVRMARECELQDPRIAYSDAGRIPGDCLALAFMVPWTRIQR